MGLGDFDTSPDTNRLPHDAKWFCSFLQRRGLVGLGSYGDLVSRRQPRLGVRSLADAALT